jgi:hypothetical protein
MAGEHIDPTYGSHFGGPNIATLLEFRASVDRSLQYEGRHRNPDALTSGAGRREAAAAQLHDREWVRRLVIMQPRERAVGCRQCGRETWNVSAVCSRCQPATYEATPVDCPKCQAAAR